jgi:hypothetical protein
MKGGGDLKCTFHLFKQMERPVVHEREWESIEENGWGTSFMVACERRGIDQVKGDREASARPQSKQCGCSQVGDKSRRIRTQYTIR